MTGTDHYWLRFWGIVGIMFVMAIAIPATCTMHANYKVTQMVKAGADPVAAGCAISNSCRDRGGVKQ